MEVTTLAVGDAKASSPRCIPASRIPPEILTEILRLCQPPLCYDKTSERSALLFPSQVCHYWRATALSTAELWTSILIILEEDCDGNVINEEGVMRELDCARTWLSRSKQHPLTIEIAAATISLAEKAVQVLIPDCTRWKAINIEPNDMDFDASMWSQIEGNVPLLESARVFYGAGKALSVAPRLRRIQLHLGYDERRFRDLAEFPWIQLTSLDITIGDNQDIDPIYSILTTASNVNTLHISACRPITRMPTTATLQLTLPHIHTFSVISDDSEPIQRLLERLSLPGLRTVSLSQWACASSLIALSGCNLSTLDTYMNTEFDVIMLETAGALDGYIGYLPELLVSSSEINIWDELVAMLTFEPTSERIFSKLRSLEMSFFAAPDGSINMDQFADMIQSRWRPVDYSQENATTEPEQPTLSHVKLVLLDDISYHRSAIARLRTFAEEGLEITVFCGVDQDQLL